MDSICPEREATDLLWVVMYTVAIAAKATCSIPNYASSVSAKIAARTAAWAADFSTLALNAPSSLGSNPTYASIRANAISETLADLLAAMPNVRVKERKTLYTDTSFFTSAAEITHPQAGNRGVYKVLTSVVKQATEHPYITDAATKRSAQVAEQYHTATARPQGSSRNNPEVAFPDYALSLFAASSVLRRAQEDLLTLSSRASQQKRNADKFKDSINYQPFVCGYSDYPVILVKELGLTLVMVGSLVIVKARGQSAAFLTPKHLTRVHETLTAVGSIATHWDILSEHKFSDFAHYIFTTLPAKMAEDPDSIPMVIKGAKQLLIASADLSTPLGAPASDLLLESFNSLRKAHSPGIATTVKSYARSLPDAINLLNIYKALPHPDFNPERLFTSIEGLSTPNATNPAWIPLFEGALRKAVYSSIRSQGRTPTLTTISDDSDAKLLCQKSLGMQSSLDQMKQVHSLVWSKVSLGRTEKSPDDFELQPENKASAKHIQIPPATEDPREYRAAGLNNNDLVMHLQGKEIISVSSSVAKLKKLAQTPPSALVAPGVANSRYPTTSTSAKFGEVHKRDTRVFYLAERWVKTLTQAAERSTRQVIMRQKGVTITKSVSERKRVVESLARSSSFSEEGRKTIFISFDMSEFSKKFPMELVSVFGRVMNEATGADWMHLLPTVFTHTNAYFRTTGFSGVKSGIRGGFEGFLNFMWTSIHEVIMSIALEKLGIAGHVETFSDDGVLMLLIPTTMSAQDVRSLAESIQSTYRDFGLEFQFSKTLVSEDVWEFLGDVSISSSIVPQYIKELASVGATDASKGYKVFGTRVDQLVSQARASLAHGAIPTRVHKLACFLALSELTYLAPSTSPSDLLFLLTLPQAYGGVRVGNFHEFVTKTSEHPDADFLSDTLAIGEVCPVMPLALHTYLARFTVTSDSVIKAVITPHYLCQAGPRVHNESIIDAAVEQLATRFTQIPTSPLESKLGAQLTKIFKSATQILPGMLAKVVETAPQMMEYNKYKRFVKSSAVVALVERSAISVAFKKDRQLVLDLLARVRNSFSSVKNVSLGVNSLAALSSSCFPSVDLAPPRFAFQTLVTRQNFEHAMPFAEVLIRASAPTSFAANDYIEHVEHYLPGHSTLKWSTEGAQTEPERSMLVFLEKAASILPREPWLEPVLVALADDLGVGLSFGNALTRKNIRRRVNFTDASLFIPNMLKHSVSVRFAGVGKKWVVDGVKANFTHFISRIKSLAVANYLHDAGAQGASKGDHYTLYLHSGVTSALFLSPNPAVPNYLPASRISPYYSEAIKSALEEDAKAAVAETSAINTLLKATGNHRGEWVYAVMQAELVKVLTNSVRGIPNAPSTTSLPVSFLPIVHRAVVATTVATVPLFIRNALVADAVKEKRSAFHRGEECHPLADILYTETDPVELDDVSITLASFISKDDRTRLGIDAAAEEPAQDYSTTLLTQYKVVLAAAKRIYPDSAYSFPDPTAAELTRLCMIESVKDSLLSDIPSWVVAPSLGATSFTSASLANAIRKVVQATIQEFKFADYGPREGVAAIYLDALRILRICIKESAHRTRIANLKYTNAVTHLFIHVRALVWEKVSCQAERLSRSQVRDQYKETLNRCVQQAVLKAKGTVATDKEAVASLFRQVVEDPDSLRLLADAALDQAVFTHNLGTRRRESVNLDFAYSPANVMLYQAALLDVEKYIISKIHTTSAVIPDQAISYLHPTAQFRLLAKAFSPQVTVSESEVTVQLSDRATELGKGEVLALYSRRVEELTAELALSSDGPKTDARKELCCVAFADKEEADNFIAFLLTKGCWLVVACWMNHLNPESYPVLYILPRLRIAKRRSVTPLASHEILSHPVSLITSSTSGLISPAPEGVLATSLLCSNSRYFSGQALYTSDSPLLAAICYEARNTPLQPHLIALRVYYLFLKFLVDEVPTSTGFLNFLAASNLHQFSARGRVVTQTALLRDVAEVVAALASVRVVINTSDWDAQLFRQVAMPLDEKVPVIPALLSTLSSQVPILEAVQTVQSSGSSFFSLLGNVMALLTQVPDDSRAAVEVDADLF